MTQSEPIVTEGLSKVYKDFWGRDKVHALADLSLTLERGEIFGLLGPNGSGKSTTIKLLLGLIFPTGGRQLREYSKGMSRRIGLAQALVNDPELLLLDEPTSGLDPIGTREMKDLILHLKSQGKTVLLSSHLLADVQDVCDRIGILDRGQLKELGRVRDLLLVRDVFQLRAKGVTPEVREAILAAARMAGAEVVSAEHPTTTLEDLFLRVVQADSRGRLVLPVAPAPVEPPPADNSTNG